VSAHRAEPFLTTSDNVVVEAMRRLGGEIEVRLAECLGLPGKADLTLSLPHEGAALTDLTGSNPKPLAGGPHYSWAVRPQQIVTLRFRTSSKVEEPKPVLEWDPMVPPAKLAALHEYSSEKGHPPLGN
jgi:hypothetical protein